MTAPFALWGITGGGPDLAARVTAALDAGIDRVILREPVLFPGVEDLLARAPGRVSLHQATPGAVALATRYGCGLHLPSTCAVPEWRVRWTGFLSYSAHAPTERHDADAVLLAPIWAPTSKPGDTRPTLGPEALTAMVGGGPQLIALGGITPERAPIAVACGADGVAVLGGIFGVGVDPARAVRSYRG